MMALNPKSRLSFKNKKVTLWFDLIENKTNWVLLYFTALFNKIFWIVSFSLLTHSHKRHTLAIYVSYTFHIYTVSHFNVNKEVTHHIDLIHSLWKHINGHCRYALQQYTFIIFIIHQCSFFFNISTARHKKQA